MVMRIGIFGLSEGNGHPFSFSAIINGYDYECFRAADWPVILAYLERQPKEAFGFEDVCVTHAWTQDPNLTAKLCAACRIAESVLHPEEMLGEVDALVIARDDWECHAELAMPFLEIGIPVFIDKPLTLNEKELELFQPYLQNGTLMSTSGLRFAYELDGLRLKLGKLGRVRFISATVLNGLDKYGIHMLDAVAGLGLPAPVRLTRLPTQHEAFCLTLADGTTLALNCLGSVGRTFHLSVFADGGHEHVDLHDNFTAFRRTLSHFIRMVQERIPPIVPAQVIDTMKLIRAAQTLAPGQAIELSHA